MDELAPCLASKEAPEITVKVCVCKFRTASDERTKPGNEATTSVYLAHDKFSYVFIQSVMRSTKAGLLNHLKFSIHG